MIPSNPELRKRISPSICYEIIMRPKNYFTIANEYVSLQKVFSRDTLLGKLELWTEMVIAPLIQFIMAIWNQKAPDMFQLMSLQKFAQLWKDWFRMRDLRSEIQTWIQIIRSIGGPFISSNDAEYHMFVYADGMQRLHDSLLVTKERAKRA